MSFQSSLETLAAAFLTFYLSCQAVGRPDIPKKIISEMRIRSFEGAASGWGCPSAFNQQSCRSFNHCRIS
jgi:hypothetical protein